jgi:2-haloacid dehalogenase
MTPELLTFDIFGTVVDWRRGLREALAPYGHDLQPADFDRVVDLQAELERGPFRTYREITAESLARALGLDPAAADAIGAAVGEWPTYPDSPAALRRLQARVPCVAMTNSDKAHGEQMQQRLGFRLSGWICAEDVRRYKPDAGFWHAVAARRGAALGRRWWHVSAYADYDLDVARRLGLTTVYVARAHARPGPADHAVADLTELAEMLAPDR